MDDSIIGDGRAISLSHLEKSKVESASHTLLKDTI